MPRSSRSAASRAEGPRARPAGDERNNAKGEATRQLLLVTAERLFAEHGIAAAPLRDIGVAAGQKNNVAVQYHFGDREGLVAAIITYRVAAIEAARVRMLGSLLVEGRQPAVSDLIKVYVHPLARHLAEGNHYLAFLSRYIIERGGYSGLPVIPSEAMATLTSILPRLMPGYPEHLLQERWTIMMTSAVHTLARYQVLSLSGGLSAPIEDLLADLERYLTAGLEAPFEAPSAAAGPDEAAPLGQEAAALG